MARTARPATGFITNLTNPPPNGTGVAGWVAWAEQLLNSLMQVIGVDPAKAVTIASDTFAPEYAGVYVLDTEGSAATDTLATIGISGVADGQRIAIRSTDATRVITVPHGNSGAGQIEFADGQSLVLNDITIEATLEFRSPTQRWHEVGIHYGNAKSSFRTRWGLAIGSAVQAFHDNLAALAGLTGAADRLAYFTGAGAMALAVLTSKARDLLACADEAAMRTFLGITAVAIFRSTNQTITTAGALIIAHGLTGRPDQITVKLICTTAEHGYSIGDELTYGTYGNGTGFGPSRGCAIWDDATNVYVRFGTETTVFGYYHKTTGAGVLFTNASWRLVIVAEKVG